MTALSIGETARRTGLTPDTLRYYERIRLIGPLDRTPGGRRVYRPRDLERLRFIRRAQTMDFSLDEIRELLAFRDSDATPRESVRQLAVDKLAAIEERFEEMRILKNELRLLVNLCRGNGDECPILDNMTHEANDR